MNICVEDTVFNCICLMCRPQTFLTLSLQDMASRVQLSGPQEAEKYVLHMVSPQHVIKHI